MGVHAGEFPALRAAARHTAGKLIEFTAGKLQLAEGGGEIGVGTEDQSPRWQEIGGDDGRDWPPFLTVFKNPPRAYAVACGIGAFVTLCTLVGAAHHMRRLLSCPSSPRRSLYVRMAGLLIVLTVSALLALCFAKVAVVFVALRSAYVGLAVLWTVELISRWEAGLPSFAMQWLRTPRRHSSPRSIANRARQCDLPTRRAAPVFLP